jgi:flagellar FliL protein
MSNRLLKLLFAMVVIFMLGMGGGMYMLWNKLTMISVQTSANAGVQPNQDHGGEAPLGPIYPLTTFIVNLADKGGSRYLRITMDLELGNAELESELNKRLPQIRDGILMILPSKRFEDISTVEGKIALRDEIMEKLNGLLAQGKITNIYFKEFVVQ